MEEVEELVEFIVFVTSVSVCARQSAENIAVKKEVKDNIEGLGTIVYDAGVVISS